MKIKTEMPKTILKICSCLITLLLIVYTFSGSVEWFHSDAASQVNFAIEMIRNKSPFPENWVGSTGIIISSYLLLPFLLLTNNMLLAKFMVQFVYICMMIACIVLFAQKGLKSQSWMLMIPCLLTYLSGEIQYDMLYVQCAYTVIILLTLLVLTMLCRTVDEDTVIKMEHWKANVGLYLIVFCSCMLGVLYLQAIYLPLLGTLAYLYVEKHKHHQITVFLPHIKGFVLQMVGILLAGGVGYLISIKLWQLSGVVGNNGVTILSGDFPEIIWNISVLVQSIFRYTGFELGVQLFSFAGILSVIRFGFFMFITIIAPILAYRKFSVQSIQNRAVMVFVLCHGILAILVLVFCGVHLADPNAASSAVSRYMVSSFVLFQLIGIHYIYTTFIQPAKLLSMVYASGATFVTLVMMIPVILAIPNGSASLEQAKGITEFLRQNGLEYGYASFWNAGNNTVLSNGSVQINAVLLNEKVMPYYWLSSEDWYDPDYYQGDTFLMLSSTELAAYAPDGLEETVLGMPDQQLSYGDFSILVYDHNIAQNGFSGVIDGSRDYTDGYMAVSEPSMLQEDGSITVQPGQLMYGPYINLGAGQYELTVVAQMQGSHTLTITAASGGEEIASVSLENGTSVLPFTLDSSKEQVEFVVHNTGTESMCIFELRLREIE